MSIKLYLRGKLSKYFPMFYQKYAFFRQVGYWPNIVKPNRIREILLKKKILSNNKFKDYVDKYKVRKIINKIIQETNINLKMTTLIGVYSSVEEIDFSQINKPCFIKANHGSDMNFFYEPGKHDITKLKQVLDNWLKIDFFNENGEMCYKGIQKKIIIEKPIFCKDGNLPDDIKVHCYFGEPSVIQIIRRRNGYLERKTFDSTWSKQNWFKNDDLEVSLDSIPTNQVLEFSKLLSQIFDYVRMDYYLVDGTLYFGEYTFFPAATYLPLTSVDVDRYLGDLYTKIEHRILNKANHV